MDRIFDIFWLDTVTIAAILVICVVIILGLLLKRNMVQEKSKGVRGGSSRLERSATSGLIRRDISKEAMEVLRHAQPKNLRNRERKRAQALERSFGR